MTKKVPNLDLKSKIRKETKKIASKDPSDHVWNFKKLLLEKIKKNGGWVNSHAHADRAFTVNPDTLDIYKKYSLVEKWDMVDVVKDASAEEYYRRASMAFEVMIEQGVTALGSFVDVDPVCEDRALKGVLKAREHYKDQITVKLINQVLKGVIEKDARKWFDIAAEKVDIIGGLPKHDELEYGKGAEHMDILLKTAKKYKKMVHVHVDQFSTVTDKETELLADKTMAYGMQGKVVAIHGISLGSHPKKYREKVYKKMKKADLMMIACPVAWIDTKRSETLQPFHNSITPIDELVPAGITVAMGTDNICDYMVPFCDGNMWSELLLLSTGNRYMEIEELVKIATVNGRKTLGIK
jgi:cytosine/adenosine deaminase-related metal-dependent hydrolase